MQYAARLPTSLFLLAVRSVTSSFMHREVDISAWKLLVLIAYHHKYRGVLT